MSDADMLAQALDALDRVQAQLERERAAAREPIAIVGIGCRFPGCDDAESFADFLARGGDAVRELPAARGARFRAPAHQALRRGGFFEDVAGFDADFFGVGEAEAIAMDPHQRLLLEVAWQALEDAGEAGGSLAGTDTGVYLGLGAQNSDYAAWLLGDPRLLDRHAIPGSFHSLMAGRVSYLLDLRGPSLVIDAACASGLAAVHLACAALRERECDAAIAAAVNLVLSPLVSAAVQQSGLWSATGQSRAFDASADGFVRGEGCAVVVLKRLSDALASGDAIRAVIHGSAVGQDGRSNGLTAPSGPAQEAVMRKALQHARVAPSEVGYVEAHATGTRLGDAIEAEALAAVYGTDRRAPLLVGAAKPGLGHLEAASGLAALVKAALAMERRFLPPTLHHSTLNPDIAASGAPLAIVTRATPWPQDAPYGGVSAFGMSGTNAHVVIGPAPVVEPLPPADGRATLRLGAHDAHALRMLAARMSEALKPGMSWRDVCASLNAGRRRFATQVEIVADGIDDARIQLQRAARGELAPAPPSAAEWKPEAPRRKVRLPSYPFQHRAYWPPEIPGQEIPVNETPVHEPGMLSVVQWIASHSPGAAAPARRELIVTGSPHALERVAHGLAAAGMKIVPMADGDTQGMARFLAAAAPADVLHVSGSECDRERALDGLLRLVRAMAQSDGAPRRLVVAGLDAATSPVPAMAISLARTVALEHPDLTCRAIEIDAAVGDPGAALADEISRSDRETWIRRTAAGREVPRVQPVALAHRAFAPRPGACYVVSGAFGGIGRAIAGWLVDRGATEVLLLGRHPRELAEAAAWRARGVRVRAVACDVADDAAVKAALAPLASEGIAVAGVFHAAGVQDDALLFQQEWPRFEQVLRAKVDGARVLREVTRHEPLDTFVLFSSIAAVTGLVGAGAYVAANAALAALARRWREEGVAALCVQWGTWEGSGMALAGGERLGTHWEALGIVPFPPALGIAALESLLAANCGEAIAARVDWPRLAGWAATEGGGATLYGNRIEDAGHDIEVLLPPGAPASHPVRSGELRDIVRATVARVLGLREDDRSLDRPFGELGLASLAAMELRSQLSARLGIPVPATLAFNHPSVDAVARFLAKRLDEARPRAGVCKDAATT